MTVANRVVDQIAQDPLNEPDIAHHGRQGLRNICDQLNVFSWAEMAVLPNTSCTKSARKRFPIDLHRAVFQPGQLEQLLASFPTFGTLRQGQRQVLFLLCHCPIEHL